MNKIRKLWNNMKCRCAGISEHHKKIYTDNGIKVCNEWLNYSNFERWALANGYDENLTLDRINGNKGYSPNNCRFTDYHTQNINKKLSKKNKTGYKDIGIRNNRYIVRLSIAKNNRVWIGAFDTLKEAVKARNKYIKEHGLQLCQRQNVKL